MSTRIRPYKGNDEKIASSHIPLMRYPNNIRRFQDAKGWTIDQAAEAMGMSRGGYLKIQRGENRLTSTTIANAARAFDVHPSEVVVSDEEKSIALMGLVSAGSEMKLFAEGQGPFDFVKAPDWATSTTVAVEIRGTSLGEIFDGWLIFYDDRREPVTDDLIGRLCVVGLVDQRIVVKRISRGQLPGRFNLISNTEPPIYDVWVQWAALVREMRPR